MIDNVTHDHVVNLMVYGSYLMLKYIISIYYKILSRLLFAILVISYFKIGLPITNDLTIHVKSRREYNITTVVLYIFE